MYAVRGYPITSRMLFKSGEERYEVVRIGAKNIKFQGEDYPGHFPAAHASNRPENAFLHRLSREDFEGFFEVPTFSDAELNSAYAQHVDFILKKHFAQYPMDIIDDIYNEEHRYDYDESCNCEY